MASSDSLKVAPIVHDRGAGDVVAARYRLVRKVGSGGMGSVWYAHDLSLDAPCAVKLIDGEKANDEGIRLRFEREAKASAQLRSAHVVNVFDYGEWNRTQYLAMEYLDGEDLSVRLTRLGQLDFETTYRVIAHVARALMAAHAVGIVHRDLKPENIFLVQSYDEEIAKVLDFGIAQHNAYSIADRATREGAFLGTPCYVSPEQARGKNIDHRSDLWSLGVIAFQCLTGQLPFEGKALGELMGQILYEPLPMPSLVNPALPERFDEWWQKAASRDRDARFQSAKEMADELASVLELRLLVVVPTVPPQRRTSIPPAEYSGVITAAKLPEAAVRTTAPAPEDEVRSDAGYSELAAKSQGLLLPGAALDDVDGYVAQLAAQDLVQGGSGDPELAPAPPAVIVPPAPALGALPPSMAEPNRLSPQWLKEASPQQPQVRLDSSLGTPRAKQASQVRFRDLAVADAADSEGSLALASQSPAHAMRMTGRGDQWRNDALRLLSERRNVIALSLAGALAIFGVVLWFTLRPHNEAVATPNAKAAVPVKQARPRGDSRPEPQPASSVAPLTVDMLPLISDKERRSKSSETSNRSSQSPGAIEPKTAPKTPRKIQPQDDYGI